MLSKTDLLTIAGALETGEAALSRRLATASDLKSLVAQQLQLLKARQRVLQEMTSAAPAVKPAAKPAGAKVPAKAATRTTPPAAVPAAPAKA